MLIYSSAFYELLEKRAINFTDVKVFFKLCEYLQKNNSCISISRKRLLAETGLRASQLSVSLKRLQEANVISINEYGEFIINSDIAI